MNNEQLRIRYVQAVSNSVHQCQGDHPLTPVTNVIEQTLLATRKI